MKAAWTLLLAQLLLAGVGMARAQSAQPSENLPAPLSLTIRPIKDVVQAGSPVDLEVTAKNMSDHWVEYLIPGHTYYRAFDVRDSAGDPPLTRRGRALLLGEGLSYDDFPKGSTPEAPEPVDPGKSVTVKERVPTDIFDLTKPGRYTIQLQPWGPDSIKSNTVTVTVVQGATPYVAPGYNLKGDELNFSDSTTTRSTTYDAADRLWTFQATLPGLGNQNLLNVTQYGPVGMLQGSLGNGLTETRAYNNRNWLQSLTVANSSSSVYSLGLSYYGNGNVYTANDSSQNGNWTYGYDTVNRLQTASGNGQSFSYNINRNPWGNMTCSNTGNLPCTPLGLTFNAATNQINSSGYTYDAAGNLLTDNTHGYVYDGENRIACVGVDINGNCATTATYYFYDAQGQRVGKQQFNTLEDYVYDPQGHITSVHDGSANPLRSELYSPDGRHVATFAPNPNGQYMDPYPPGLFYNHADWLGTERLRTNSGGTPAEWCTDTPYGMNLTCNSPLGIADASPLHFTGKQRDAESGLDNFTARYYGSGNALGRFMSPDWSDDPDPVPYADFGNPQSLNLYTYVLNNPLTSTDADGHYHCDPDTATTDANGTMTVHGGACHLDWSDLATVTGTGLLVSAAKATAKVGGQVLQQLSDIWNTPGGPGCMGALAGAGAGAGGIGGGEVGLAGGPFAEITVPTFSAGGAIGGAGVGIATAMTACPGGAASSGGGGGGGGGQKPRPLQSGNSNTITSRTASALNQVFGKDLVPREWGRALEELKTDNGISNDAHGKPGTDGTLSRFLGDKQRDLW